MRIVTKFWLSNEDRMDTAILVRGRNLALLAHCRSAAAPSLRDGAPGPELLPSALVSPPNRTGLHRCANAASEMGGRLSAHSDGPGLGARFELVLPIGRTQT